MAGSLVGWKNALPLLPYGDRFRRYRRMFHAVIGSRASMDQFLPIEELQMRKFLRRILSQPTDLAAHIRHSHLSESTAGSIILRISHGYDVKETNDPFVELADKATEQFALCTVPGAFMVDILPILRHIPAWFPGASFQKKATEWSATLNEMVERPHTFVKSGMAEGTAPVSFTSSLLEDKKEDELDIKWSAASLYAGGADTTVSANYSFFLAMALHPDVAKKAQAEIDSVIGNDRLPTFDDRSELPYVDALAKEVLRWHVVAPMGKHPSFSR
ncbi:hypothetical protein H0H87_004047 [Tephrocybe sp. NHM501043]|nr:hypothetical protein H0H87_004047 [Tephrocybe sp. NHM501043]